MPVDVTPDALAAAASCYRCFDEKSSEAVKIYLLAVAAGLETKTADELMALAACYACIPMDMQQPVQNYLLDKAVNG